MLMMKGKDFLLWKRISNFEFVNWFRFVLLHTCLLDFCTETIDLDLDFRFCFVYMDI